MPTENTLNEMRALVNEHIDKWVAAGKFHLPDVNDCLEYLCIEIAEAMDAQLRLNPAYVRNTSKKKTQIDVAIELFDALNMIFIYEKITRRELQPNDCGRDGTFFKKIHRALNLASIAIVEIDENEGGASRIHYTYTEVYIEKCLYLLFDLIEHLGFDPLEIAREKLREMDVKRGFA